MTIVHSWGLLTRHDHEVVSPADRAHAIRSVTAPGRFGLASGLQRSYGDVSLNEGGRLWDMRFLDRFIAFDEATGQLSCEAGVTIREVQALFSDRGWMMPVTPGTEYVTIGGAIANDVHGKNHHIAGSIGNHVLGLTLLRTDGEIIEATQTENADWLSATIGGMGLTGVILCATIQLKNTGGPWIDAEDVVFGSLKDFFELSTQTQHTHEYSVSWIDVTTDRGRRGIFTRGNTAEDQTAEPPSERSLPFPMTPPLSLVNTLSVRTFNRLYYRAKTLLARQRTVHYRPFFYPLDSILHWNRMYGPRGFYQYQSVVPFTDAEEVTQEMLGQISRSGLGSFLGVLKTFGDVLPVGLMSFPSPGVTFALDFPERGDRTAELFARLDRIVSEADGRLYPAKDARMPRGLFESGYPKLETFLQYRDPGISSEMSRRLMGA